MIDLLGYLIKQGRATQTKLFPDLDAAALGLPAINPAVPCHGAQCCACLTACPTGAVQVAGEKDGAVVRLDLGACIGCGLCITACPTGTIVRHASTKTAVTTRDALVLSNQGGQPAEPAAVKGASLFKKAFAVRVVSTGCAACDLEIGAAGNPIFDIDRFGISVVASPRMADAVVITGPVGKGMQDALRRVYEAMAEPRLVIALGTCAISGGVHKGGYAEANGAGAILPVDVFIPGCPPHPWSVAYGLMLAMGRVGPAAERSGQGPGIPAGGRKEKVLSPSEVADLAVIDESA